MNRTVKDLMMALVAPGVVVALMVNLDGSDLRVRLRQSPWTAPRDITSCKSNLKNVGTALEMYSTDNSGRYPLSLGQLTPDYLWFIPTCPARGLDTYSAGFQSTSNPDAYTVWCSGRNHPRLGPDKPEYNSTQGLMER